METELDLRVSVGSDQLDAIRSQVGALFVFSLAKPPSQSVLISSTRKSDAKSTEQAILEFIADLDVVLPLLPDDTTKTLRVAEFIEVGEAAAFGLDLSKVVLGAIAERSLDLEVMFFPCT